MSTMLEQLAGRVEDLQANNAAWAKKSEEVSVALANDIASALQQVKTDTGQHRATAQRLTTERDELRAKCHELEQQLAILQTEKTPSPTNVVPETAAVMECASSVESTTSDTNRSTATTAARKSSVGSVADDAPTVASNPAASVVPVENKTAVESAETLEQASIETEMAGHLQSSAAVVGRSIEKPQAGSTAVVQASSVPSDSTAFARSNRDGLGPPVSPSDFPALPTPGKDMRVTLREMGYTEPKIYLALQKFSATAVLDDVIEWIELHGDQAVKEKQEEDVRKRVKREQRELEKQKAKHEAARRKEAERREREQQEAEKQRVREKEEQIRREAKLEKERQLRQHEAEREREQHERRTANAAVVVEKDTRAAEFTNVDPSIDTDARPDATEPVVDGQRNDRHALG